MSSAKLWLLFVASRSLPRHSRLTLAMFPTSQSAPELATGSSSQWLPSFNGSRPRRRARASSKIFKPSQYIVVASSQHQSSGGYRKTDDGEEPMKNLDPDSATKGGWGTLGGDGLRSRGVMQCRTSDAGRVIVSTQGRPDWTSVSMK